LLYLVFFYFFIEFEWANGWSPLTFQPTKTVAIKFAYIYTLNE